MSALTLRTLRLAVTVACFALLWLIVDGDAALRRLSEADAVWLALALLCLTLQTILSALRWRLTAGQLGIALEYGPALREYYLAQIVNQLLPGGVLGDAGRAVRARAQAGLLASGQAVLFERLAGQLALLIVFGVAVMGTSLVPGGFEGPAWLMPFTLLLLAACGIVLGVVSIARRDTGRAWGAVVDVAAPFLHTIAAPTAWRRQTVLSLGTALLNIAAFACCAAAVDTPLPAPAALVLVPIILFSMLIPFTVSGWGFREGAAAALLPLAGATSAAGLAASLAFGLAVFAAALPGLAVLVLAALPDPVGS
jgi:uncharacterized membrane protein YbhN (UPF0104 family)